MNEDELEEFLDTLEGIWLEDVKYNLTRQEITEYFGVEVLVEATK